MLPVSFTKVIHFSADGSVGRSVLCRRTEAFATAAVGVITKLRGTPILYRLDEPDSARPGGCPDLIPSQEGCEPYQPVEAPTGTADVVRRVAADPYVNCAIAVDAVKARLGSDLTPVVIDNGSCRFVEPAHKLDLSVKVHNFSLGSFGNEVQIAGRAARHKVIDAGPGNRRGDMRFVHLDVAVDDYTTLRLELAEMRGRAATPGARIDTSREAALQPLAADIVTKYF